MSLAERTADADAPALDEQSLRTDRLVVTAERQSGLFGRDRVTILDGVDIAIPRREVVGLVGESGSGKTTAARALIGLQRPSAGRVLVDGVDLYALNAARRYDLIGHKVGVIFQDPRTSLNRRLTIGNIIEDPMMVQGWSRERRRARLSELAEAVGLPDSAIDRKPFQLSGGQLQRVALARALAMSPDYVVADEPTSALDVSVQAQILNMIVSLRRQHSFGMLLITHDIRVVRFLSDHTVVIYLGRVVESGPTEKVHARPRHPYTKALLAAVPHISQPRAGDAVMEGTAPHPSNRPSGCPFRTRCPRATEDCASDPIPQHADGDHLTRCLHPEW